MRLVDRYVLRQFASTLFFSVGALCVIFIVVDMLESLDAFLDHNATFGVIVTYYVSFLPQILELLFPVGMLLASLFSIGRLSTNNETTAMRSSGMSLYRLMAPLLVFGLTMSFAQLYFNGWIVPVANAEKFRIEREYLARGTGGEALYRLYFRDQPTRNVSVESYDAIARQGRIVSIETFTNELHPRLLERIEAPIMNWDTVRSAWVAPTAIRRVTIGDSLDVTTVNNAVLPFAITHDRIVRLQRNTDELTFDELWDYIETKKIGGKDTRRLEIDYYGQWAFPFANAIVLLIAVPFASVRRRGGIAVNIAAAMVVSFVYIAFSRISQAMGTYLDFPVWVVAWSSNALFFLVGLTILVRTRT
mgnify:FL=1